MDNSISSIGNISFNSRYLRLNSDREIPQKIIDAIYKSEAIDEFLKAGKPKTIWGKIIDLFRKDVPLDIKYVETVVALPKKVIPKEICSDKYAKACNLKFNFGNKNGCISAEQKGVKRQSGSVPKPNEDYRYKPPVVTAEDKLVKQIEEITDLEKILK